MDAAPWVIACVAVWIAVGVLIIVRETSSVLRRLASLLWLLLWLSSLLHSSVTVYSLLRSTIDHTGLIDTLQARLSNLTSSFLPWRIAGEPGCWDPFQPGCLG